MSIRITTSNIRSFPLQPMNQVHARIRRAAQFDGINFGQELLPNRHRGRSKYAEIDAWEKVMASFGKNTYGKACEVPISVPRYWTVEHAEMHLLTHAVPGELAPNRYATVVEAVRESDGLSVTFINGHPEQGPRSSPVRGQLYDHYEKMFMELVREARNRTHVVYGGDLQLARLNKYYQAPHVVVAQVGIDYLFAAPRKGHKATLLELQSVPRNDYMDHPIVSAHFKFSKD